MNLYQNGFIVAEIGDGNNLYNAWPLSELNDDKGAEALTDEADDNWFIKYEMQHIIPDLDYVKKYYYYCTGLHLKVKVLLMESPDNSIVIDDNVEVNEVLGFDCIGSVYHSYLQTEYNDFRNDLMKKGITLNKYGLLNSLEDVLYFIDLRQRVIAEGINLEDFWKELPVKISIVNI